MGEFDRLGEPEADRWENVMLTRLCSKPWVLRLPKRACQLLEVVCEFSCSVGMLSHKSKGGLDVLHMPHTQLAAARVLRSALSLVATCGGCRRGQGSERQTIAANQLAFNCVLNSIEGHSNIT